MPAEQSRQIRSDLGRTRAEAGGPAVARVPGRPDVDRDRHGDAVRGPDPDVREDVRVPYVLRGQAHRDGGPDRPL